MEEDSKALTQEDVKDLLDLVEKYRKEREQKLGELPFFYNILEEVRVNENAHTRLLMRLLEYKPARQHFFNYLAEHKGFASLTMPKPTITAEKHRIDGLIQEKGEYAIIIENKVCGAVEQGRQLEKYIDKCMDDLVDDLKKVYILYLVNSHSDAPSQQTWGKYKKEDFGSREEFGNRRYLQLSYEDDIVSWLGELLAKLQVDSAEKSDSLQTGIAQYLDYLKLMFKIDEYSKKKKDLTIYVEEELGLKNKTVAKALTFLEQQQESIEDLNLRSEFERLHKYYQIKVWGETFGVRNESEQGYSKDVFIDDTAIGNLYPKVGIYYQIEGKGSFVALVEYDIETTRGKSVAVGLRCSSEFDVEQIKCLQDVFNEKLEKVLCSKRASGAWYRWCEVKPDEAMTKFDELVEALKELGATPVPAEKAKE